jgi:hypothetical protein
MSKLMLIFGVLFLATGVALGLLIHFRPGQMQVLALTPDVSAIFLVGGAVCLGLGNVAAAVREYTVGAGSGALMKDEAAIELAGSTPATPKFEGFGSKAAAVAAEPTEAEADAALKTSVADTISALEQAKSDIAIALGVEPQFSEPVGPKPEMAKATTPVAAPAETEPVAEEADLYVVEEKVIRGRPARVLSDGTVEAETDEGWMRFENLEHLDEYLEAMVPEA